MKTVLILSALVLSAATMARPPKMISCAVMSGNKVNIAKATKAHQYADYKGNRYFFCCGDCPSAFKKNPAKYAKAPHIKTPKAPHVKTSKVVKP
ncbi:MAG: YHS domain-containing protein [Fimbriimonadaceae bacterium]